MRIFGLLILVVFLATMQTHSIRLPMPYGTGFPVWFKPMKGTFISFKYAHDFQMDSFKKDNSPEEADPENLTEAMKKARSWFLVLSRMKRVFANHHE